MGSSEESSGVRGSECCESKGCNKGDLTRPPAHNRREQQYKPEAKSAATPGEKSDEVVVPMMVKTAKLYLGKGLYFNNAFVRR
jgi:hypothetical protein